MLSKLKLEGKSVQMTFIEGIVFTDVHGDGKGGRLSVCCLFRDSLMYCLQV